MRELRKKENSSREFLLQIRDQVDSAKIDYRVTMDLVELLTAQISVGVAVPATYEDAKDSIPF